MIEDLIAKHWKAVAMLIVTCGLGLYGLYQRHEHLKYEHQVWTFKQVNKDALTQAKNTQQRLDAAAIKSANETAASAALQAQSALSAAHAAHAAISRYKSARDAAEAHSKSAYAQGHECLDPAIRKAEGYKAKCP